MARLDSRVLLDFLEEVGKELERKITLIAVGGTALTLLSAKSSTRDVDFTLPSDDYGEFQRALKNTPRGFVVHCFHDGMIFSQLLPDDYLSKNGLEAQDEKHPSENPESSRHRSYEDRTLG